LQRDATGRESSYSRHATSPFLFIYFSKMPLGETEVTAAMRFHFFVCMCVYMYTCTLGERAVTAAMQVHLGVCVCIYVYTYTHTHAYKYVSNPKYRHACDFTSMEDGLSSPNLFIFSEKTNKCSKKSKNEIHLSQRWVIIPHIFFYIKY
jgi:hypothetical protein